MMFFQMIRVNKIKVGVLAVLVSAASVCYAERYYTWVDENGNVRHTILPEDSNPLIKKQDVSSDESKSDSGRENKINLFESPKVDVPSEMESSSGVLVPAPGKLPSDEYEGEVYVDGVALEREGGIRSEEDMPYYLWRDNEGRTYYQFYNPKKERDGQLPTTKVAVHQLSQFMEYRERVPVAPVGVDAYAEKLFFSDSDSRLFENFSSSCCTQLDKNIAKKLSVDVSEAIYLDRESGARRLKLPEGESFISLIQLPVSQHGYKLSIRSFVKSSRREGYENAVYMPALSMLDSDLKAKRLLRDVTFEFVPENWQSHGYIRFVINVMPGERFLLLSTTDESLSGKSHVRENGKVMVLNHAEFGLVDIKVLAER